VSDEPPRKIDYASPATPRPNKPTHDGRDLLLVLAFMLVTFLSACGCVVYLILRAL
jgi:hypothetical protein